MTRNLRGSSEGREKRALVALRRCNTVKLQGVPKAFATACAPKGVPGTGVMTQGMVTTQKMPQWITCSQILRALTGLRMQFND